MIRAPILRRTLRPAQLASVQLMVLALVGCPSGDGPSGPGDPTDTNLLPVATFTLQTFGSGTLLGIAVDASASSDVDGDVEDFQWRFGDGGTASGSSASHVFETAGSFEITLTVTDDQGGQDSTSQTVVVVEGTGLRIVGVVWHDQDGDGAQDIGEVGVPGQTVFLDENRDGSWDPGEVAATTGAGGVYEFTGVPPGEHTVTQALGLGWTNTSPGPPPSVSAAAGASGPARILNGRDAPADYPFMVSIQLADEAVHRDAHICGGSLVAPEWVLTASHCLSDSLGTPFPLGFLEILVGTTRLDGTGTRIAVEEVVLNPGYSPAGGFYKRDISLVRLSERLDEVPRVFLMDSTVLAAQVEPGDLGTLTGWGLLGDASVIPEALQVAQIPLRANRDCVDTWNDGDVERFDSTMLCVGHLAGTPDSCSGDSGGPWMFDIAGRLYQAGAVSWGPIPCGRPTLPSAYASVPAMLAFVQETIPGEPSGSVVVTVNATSERVDFGNFH